MQPFLAFVTAANVFIDRFRHGCRLSIRERAADSGVQRFKFKFGRGWVKAVQPGR
jgi:hypothetical protein